MDDIFDAIKINENIESENVHSLGKFNNEDKEVQSPDKIIFQEKFNYETNKNKF